MNKPKFNIEIFLQVLSKLNLPEYIISRPHMLFDYALSKGFGYDGYDNLIAGRDWVNPDYSRFENPKKSFNSLSKLLEYTPLIQTIDNNPEGVWISKQEFGYLNSKKSNISLLITSSFYHGDGHSSEEPEPISIFNKFDNKKTKELPKILLDILKKRKNNGIRSFTNLVNLNNKFIWDKKLLEVVFKKDLKIRTKSKKDDRKNGLDYPDWYYNIYFFLTLEKKMTSKDPTNTNLFKATQKMTSF